GEHRSRERAERQPQNWKHEEGGREYDPVQPPMQRRAEHRRPREACALEKKQYRNGDFAADPDPTGTVAAARQYHREHGHCDDGGSKAVGQQPKDLAHSPAPSSSPARYSRRRKPADLAGRRVLSFRLVLAVRWSDDPVAAEQTRAQSRA